MPRKQKIEEKWQEFFDSRFQEKLLEERRWQEKMFNSVKREVEGWILNTQQEWRHKERAQRNRVGNG